MAVGLSEDDRQDIVVSTGALPVGQYYIRGTIDDLVNPAVTVFALKQNGERVVVTILESGMRFRIRAEE